MSQNVERAKVIKQIKALSEQTVERGQSEAHAELAMKRIGSLMTTYNISLDEIALGGQACIKAEYSTGSTKRTAINYVTVDIAAYLDCIVWFSKDRATAYKRDKNGMIKRCGTTGRPLKERGNSKTVFFGFESDVEMAVHLCDIIQKAVDYESTVFKKSDIYANSADRRGKLEDFQRGMVSRIGMRLREMKSTQDREVRAAQAGEKDLVVMKANKVKEEFKTTGTTLRSGGRTAGRGGSAFNAGREAGAKVNLNRPIGGQGGGQLLLK